MHQWRLLEPTRANPQFKMCSICHLRHVTVRPPSGAPSSEVWCGVEWNQTSGLSQRNIRTPNVRKPVLCSVTNWPQMNFVTDKCSLLSRKIRKPSVELQKTVPETTDNRAWNYQHRPGFGKNFLLDHVPRCLETPPHWLIWSNKCQ